VSTVTAVTSHELTAQDLTDRFGPIPLRRICFDPWPGTATEEDFLALVNRDDKLYELVDGIIVEKPMGLPEAVLAVAIASFIRVWVAPRKLGIVAGADGMMRLAPGLVRYPDVSFMRASRFPNGRVQRIQVPNLVPDLAVEVLSPSNTEREMDGKRRHYFAHGTHLVWMVDPETRTVEVYTAPDQSVVLTVDQTLDGGDVLPGFQLPIRDIFADMEDE
jgi:Uma2 family endonuclease